MSLESITDGVARVLAGVSGMKAAYASAAGGQGDTVRSMPQDVSDTPVALVVHGGFDVQARGFERIRHTIVADVYFNAASAGAANKTALPLITRCITAMRADYTLFGACVSAVIESGGPPRAEESNTKTYMVYPLIVDVLEAAPQDYLP